LNAGLAIRNWWFPPAPLARLAVLRTFLYLFVVVDVLWTTSLVVPQSYASPELYQPVDLLNAIGQPAPGPSFTQTLRIVVIVSALIAASGRLGRVAGWVAAFAYLDWCCLAMSYGKVDHDHLAILVAVFVLPTVAGLRWRAADDSEAAGWALRCIAVATVATYFLSAWAKFRFGGWHWPLGATFTWAVERRGTALGRPLLHHAHVLQAAQFSLLALELSTPLLLLLRQRWRTSAVVGLALFHLTTWLTIRIHFLPLAVCLAAFLPLERIAAYLTSRRSTPAPATAMTREVVT
jgi:hypothetical protein